MKKELVSGIMLTLLLFSMLTLAFNIQLIKSEPRTWTVDDDGSADFSSIQEAINAASSGETIFVHSGAYYENVVVNKTVSLIGEDRDITIIDGNLTKSVIEVTSGNVIISDFTMINSKGLGIYGSSGNTIKNNIIKWNRHGVLLNQSSNNLIKNNIISGNWGSGVYLYHSNNNIIMNNNISNNGVIFCIVWYSWDGIELYDSNNNTILHNNLVGNTVSNRGTNSVNTWDNGYPSGGNYWGDVDYFGSDLYGGPFQNVSGSDGIGDTPYFIDKDNQDNYPLMNPWASSPPIPPSPPKIARVDVNPDTLNLKSKGRWITAHIELPEGYNISNIDRSTILLNDTIPVDSFWLDKPFESVIGDYDNDGITDLMVKFDRQALIEYIRTKGIRDAEVTLAITGEANGKSFEVTDTIKVIGQ